MDYYSKELDKSNLLKYIGNISQLGGIEIFEHTEGKSKGVRVAQVNTGVGLTYKVVVDRGMDIAECFFKGRAISWISKTGIVHPAYYNQFKDEKLRSFYGGLLTTCGLTNAGPWNEFNGEYEGQHGRISDIPCDNYFYETCWEGQKLALVQRGRVVQSKIFNENLVMKREIKSYFGENTIFIKTEIKNEGFEKVPLMYLMHMNFGYPILSKDTKVKLDSKSITPRDNNAKKGLGSIFEFKDPTENFKEEVYFVDLKTDKSGFAKIYLYDDLYENYGLVISYKKEDFKNLTIWKMLGYNDYVLGIEPGNCNPLGRVEASEKNELEFIEPGQSRSFNLSLEFISKNT